MQSPGITEIESYGFYSFVAFTFADSLICGQGLVGVVFYDMTTLYFEAESEDDLRKIGYSKDGKHQHPQIMIGLLVGAGGIPIAYDVFEGNTAETKTLIPILNRMVEKFKVDRPTIIADSALLSKNNRLYVDCSG